MTRTSRTERAGYTLIELLVVIAIIGILMGMTLVGINSVRIAGIRTETRDQLSQLAAAVTTFETDRKIHGHIPSRMLLREDGYYLNEQGDIPALQLALAKDTKLFLKNCFPDSSLISMDWNGDGAITAGSAGMTYLEGHQCLVFCLGGINGLHGFSSDPRNPTTSKAVRAERIGPYFHFKNTQLEGGAFPYCKDPYGKPFAFFSSYKRENGYNRYGNPGAVINGQVAVSDCASLGVQPYFLSESSSGVRVYHNPKSFQIISAGKDMVFGPGGLWPPVQAGGRDDMANFHSKILGAE